MFVVFGGTVYVWLMEGRCATLLLWIMTYIHLGFLRSYFNVMVLDRRLLLNDLMTSRSISLISSSVEWFNR